MFPSFQSILEILKRQLTVINQWSDIEKNTNRIKDIGNKVKI